MTKRLEENLDYTFSYKDLLAIDKLMKKYISDREEMYKSLFNSTEEYTKDDVKEYVEWFMGNASDMDIDKEEPIHHKYLYRIKHFLERNYEFNLLPSYNDIVWAICDCMSYYGLPISDMNDEEVEEFVENEMDCIEGLKNNWNAYLETLANYPLMHLENMKKTTVMGAEVYYDKNTQEFVLNNFLEFLQNVKHDFPQLISKFDRFLIVDNDYLKFLACDEDGQGETQAFFTDNAIFLKCKCDNLKDENERFFYKEVLYHEFGHYVFSMMAEYLQAYWFENYAKWKENDVKMCRDKDRNSQLDVYCEELWADCFACFYLGDKMTDEDYIHLPSPMITDVFEFILRKGFIDE